MRRYILISVLFFILNSSACAQEDCKLSCGYDDFFNRSYNSLIECMEISENSKRLFETLFNAYSIKFKVFDMEYQDLCKKLNISECSKSEIKKEINNLTEMAIEEFDSFLNDISFEVCGCEGADSREVKRARARVRRPLKKMISNNCKSCIAK